MCVIYLFSAETKSFEIPQLLFNVGFSNSQLFMSRLKKIVNM